MGGKGGQGFHRSQSLHIPKSRDGYGGATPRAAERPRHGSTSVSRSDGGPARSHNGQSQRHSSSGWSQRHSSSGWDLRQSSSAGRFFKPMSAREQNQTARTPRAHSTGPRPNISSPTQSTPSSPKDFYYSTDFVLEHTGIPTYTELKWNTNTKKRSAEQEIYLAWSDPDPGNFDYRNPREIAESRLFELRERRLGPYDLQAFRIHMCKKYWNLVRAFRLGLDTTGNGILTKCEFGPAVRREGFEGSTRKLWNELDDDGTGTVTMNEWAPKEAPVLEAFKKHLVENYETAETAWWDLCRHKETYLKLDAFTQACKQIGFQGDTSLLHRLLCSDRAASKFVTLKDIDWIGNCDFGVGGEENEGSESQNP